MEKAASLSMRPSLSDSPQFSHSLGSPGLSFSAPRREPRPSDDLKGRGLAKPIGDIRQEERAPATILDTLTYRNLTAGRRWRGSAALNGVAQRKSGKRGPQAVFRYVEPRATRSPAPAMVTWLTMG